MAGEVFFIHGAQLLFLTANLGDSRSNATHAARTTLSSHTAEEGWAVGMAPGLARISVALEYIDDIIAVIAQSLPAG